MRLAEFSVDRPVTVFMIVLVGVFLGAISITGIPVDLFPELEFPFVTISTVYQDVAPQEVENLVTKRIEEAVASVENVKNIHSVSSEGVSLVMVEFEWGTKLETARLDVREVVDRARPLLPSEAEDPVVTSFSIMGQEGALRLSLTSPNRDLEYVRRAAEDVMKPRLERIPGVAAADILGGLEREIHVWVDTGALRSYGLTLGDLSGALGRENLNRPGGRVTQGKVEYLVRTLGKFATLEDIGAVVVGWKGDQPVRLRDVVRLEDGFVEQRDFARFNGVEAVEVVVRKESGGNTVQISDDVKKELEALKRTLPDIEMTVSFDTALFIKDSIQMVKDNALTGSLLAAAVLFLFLRNIPATLVIAMSIPISIVWTFILVKFWGMTFNILSLGGLALGVGMLVDNSIIVLENIYRHKTLDPDPDSAAKKGASEITLAVLASTFTTLAVFLPILWIEGIAKEIFTDLSLTVAFSLASSIVVALTVVPMLGSRLLRLGGRVAGEKDAVRTMGRFSEGYIRAVSWAVAHYKTVILVSVLTFFASLAGWGFFIGQEFFPKMNEDTFNLSLKMPVGFSLEETKAVSGRVEAGVSAHPEVRGVLAEVKPGRVDYGVTLKADRKKDTEDVIEDLRHALEGIPDAEILFRTHGPGGGGAPVQVELRGEDLDELGRLADKVKAEVATVPGTLDLTTSVEKGRPELTIRVDRARVADRGVRVGDVSDAVETAVAGRVGATLERGGDEIDIRVQLPPRDRASVDSLAVLPVGQYGASSLLLGDLADIRVGQGPQEITRKNQRRIVTVNSDRSPGVDLGTVVKAVQEKVATLVFPDGYEWEMGGEAKDIQEAFTALFQSLFIAIALVYMILAAQFESLVHPFTIMLTIPFAVVGVFLSLVLTGTAFSIPAFIGLIMLAGIVVNNAIVLVDYVLQTLREGTPLEEALVTSGSVRLRPILMTTLTTVLGMLPMALGWGAGSAFYVPLGITVIGGLSFSTLLTLFVIPCVFKAVEKIRERTDRWTISKVWKK